MTKVIGIRKPWSLTIRKKFGNPLASVSGGVYGVAIYGSGGYGSEIVDPNSDFYGVYQMRRCKEGYIPVQMKFYSPTNPQTEIQQSNRQKIADAVLAWQDLTDEQKEVYNENASGMKLTGYNLFVKNYLLSH